MSDLLFVGMILLLIGLGLPVTKAAERPEIEKRGTLDCDMVETTPFVFGGQVYRLEWVRTNYRGNRMGRSYLRVVERDTGAEVSAFGEEHCFACAYVEDDTVYVAGTKYPEAHTVTLFASRDLKQWEAWTALDDPRYGIFNTSLCRAEDRYVLMFEIDRPPEETGVRFTARFATSSDLRTWQLTPPECLHALDRYTAPHCLRYHAGWFYNFYLEAVPGGYEQCVVRSHDLVQWEASPLNPVLRASDEDRRPASPRLTPEERDRLAAAVNLNNSDIDFCEYQGQVIINYSWGNQTGIEHLAEAIYAGSLAQFLTAWFPEER